MVIELDPVDRITAGALGEPGARVFYLQGRKGDELITLLVEKQQVQLLAASVVEILARVGKETGQGPADDAMELEEPVSPEWRAGRLSISYREDRDLVILEAEELVPEDAQADEEAAEEEEEASEPPTALEAFGPELRVVEVTGEEEEEEEEEEEDEDQDEEEEDEEAEALREALAEALEAAAASSEESDEASSALADLAHTPQRARFWATREQMLSLARHGALVCAAGRPRCQLCGNPMDPEGHVCPALNGHRQSDR